jgi:hypothetical protein
MVAEVVAAAAAAPEMAAFMTPAAG